MLYLGKMNSLSALKSTVHGMFLGEPEGDLEVLLPKKYVPDDLDIDDEIDVFLYTDSEDRPVATTLTPKVLLHQMAVLEVKDVTSFGAFLDWGLDKDLFIPFREQEGHAAVGDKITICLCYDEQTDRLFASAKIKGLLERTITVAEGDEVDLLIDRKTDIGYQVIINHLHMGLIFFDKIFRPLSKGDTMKGFVDTIREDGKIDISLQKKGYTQVIDSQDVVLNKLKENKGVLYLTDKSDSKEIVQQLLMSKKNFKKCLGSLYKQRKINIEKDRIVLL